MTPATRERLRGLHATYWELHAETFYGDTKAPGWGATVDRWAKADVAFKVAALDALPALLDAADAAEAREARLAGLLREARDHVESVAWQHAGGTTAPDVLRRIDAALSEVPRV